MQVQYDEQLIEYMNKHKKECILVEVASSNTSDFDVSEIYLRFVPNKFADKLISDKRYRAYEAPIGRLVLPPYHMHISETINVSIKGKFFIHWLKQDGLKL